MFDSKLSGLAYHVLNGGDPGGALKIKSVNGMTYPMAMTINIRTMMRLQRSVQNGVLLPPTASGSTMNSDRLLVHGTLSGTCCTLAGRRR